MARWRVTYTIAAGVEMATQNPAYPALHVMFDYDATGRLIAVHHELDSDDAAPPEAVVAASEAQLALLWDAFNFRIGAPVPFATRHAQKLVASSTLNQVSHGFARISGTTRLVNPLSLPREGSMAAPPNRLRVWLRLSNEARDDKNVVSGLRDYFLILEDRYHGQTLPIVVQQVKSARDFVSHGKPLTNADLLDFLRAQFGYSVNRFDPHDLAHEAFVRKWRDNARDLVEQEIEALL
jgi:hypothetical protein